MLLKGRLLDRTGYGSGGVFSLASPFPDLADLWLADLELRDISEGTKDNYRDDLRLHVQPFFENYTLGEISTGRVEHFLIQRRSPMTSARRRCCSAPSARSTRTARCSPVPGPTRRRKSSTRSTQGSIRASMGTSPDRIGPNFHASRVVRWRVGGWACLQDDRRARNDQRKWTARRRPAEHVPLTSLQCLGVPWVANLLPIYWTSDESISVLKTGISADINHVTGA